MNLDIECFTGGMLATNGYVARGPTGDGGVVIDAPRGFATWLSARGLRPVALLLTHQHFDHIEGAAEIAEEFACPVYAFAPHARALTLEDLFGGFAGLSLEIRPFAVTHVLAEPSPLPPRLDLTAIAGVSFDLVHVPGHSPDSICFLHRESGNLFGGDVLMSGGIGRSDFPGGDGDLLVRGIRERILPLGDDVTVWPGHGPPTTVGRERASNPFL